MTTDTPIGPPSPFLTAGIFSPPGLGKTSRALAVAPTAICLGNREAIVTVGENTLGFTPTVWPWWHDGKQWVNLAEELAPGATTLPAVVDDLEKQQQVLSALAETGWGESFGAVYADDQTFIDKGWLATHKEWMRYALDANDASMSRFVDYNRNGDLAENVWGLYGELGNRKMKLSGTSLNGRFHFLCSAHEIQAGSDPKRGVQWPTGPDFGSKSLILKVPAWYSFCARLVRDPAAYDLWLKRSFYVDKDNLDRVMSKDRTDVCWTNTPADLRAILTASATPFRLTRPKGLQFLDEIMEEVAEAVVAAGGVPEPVSEALRKAFKSVTGRAHVPLQCTTNAQRHARWGCQEGLALGIIRLKRGKASALDGWGGLGASSKKSAKAPPPPPSAKKAPAPA